MSWTDDRVATLTKLWTDGESASAIAYALGEVTRNAVIGKAHRLGLAARETTSRHPRSRHGPSPSLDRLPVQKSRKPSFFRASPGETAAAKPPPIPLAPAPEIPVTVQTLSERLCHWPEGDPKRAGFHFCGRPKTANTGPYCAAHASLAYR
ncbi:MAG: GcrA family cell cycle regulator [Rhodomicrobium sp.]